MTVPVQTERGTGSERESHLLVVGAGPYQLPAIRLARDRGLRVTATDMDPHAVGAQLADEFGVVSTRDADATRAFALELHRRHRVDGVMTMASESAVTVAVVADALGLPGLDPGTAERATHKGQRQEAFHRAGVPSPRFIRARERVEAEDACGRLGLPVVVKPVDSAGSRGVRKIAAVSELPDAMREIESVSDRGELIIEDFLQGTEHSIEGIVIDGRVHWTGFSDRNYADKEVAPPHFREDGDTLPTILPPAVVARVHEVATAAVEALGIDWGPVKGDILIDERGPHVLEVAARLSGDYFCDETVPLHNGIELVPAVMDLSLGHPVSPERLRPRFERGVALRGIWSRGGVVERIRGLERARSMPGVKFVRLEPRWERTPLPLESSPTQRIGAVLAQAPGREEAIRRAERAVTAVELEFA